MSPERDVKYLVPMNREIHTQNHLAEVAHIVVMTLAYSSPLWLDWRLIALGVVLYLIQIKIFGGCILTKAQFGTYDASFTYYYLDKIVSFFNGRLSFFKTKFVLDYFIPPLYIVVALISQIVFKYQPPVHL